MEKKTIEDIEIKEKKVLVRVDFNVPLDSKGNIEDDLRIQAALPTIQYLIDNGAKVILMSHLGRPKGQVVKELSLKPVYEYLHEQLEYPVHFATDCIGQEVRDRVSSLGSQEILLLENLRFHAEEKANDASFAKELASLADVYVNDAFGTAHRAHASTAGVPEHLPAVAGYLMVKELKYLVKAIENPKRPFTAIIGGKKVEGKIKVLNRLLKKADNLLIGGGMMFTFLKAQGKEIGNSVLDEDGISTAKEVITAAKENNRNLVLPVDVVIADEFDNEANREVVSVDDMKKGWLGLDIGPDTVQMFSDIIEESNLVVWNGPVGVFELSNFATGTKRIAEAIATSKCDSIIGGGDTASAIRKFGYAKDMSHISTGGGASLELLEGSKLPGLEALDDK